MAVKQTGAEQDRPPGRRWDRVEQPILEALAAGDGSAMHGRKLEAATGIERPLLMRGLRSLKDDDYIDASLMSVGELDDPIEADNIRLRPKGLRHTGLWPSEDLSTALVAALENAIRDEADEQERTKLEAVRGTVKTAAGMTLNAVIANAVGIGRAHLGL